MMPIPAVRAPRGLFFELGLDLLALLVRKRRQRAPMLRQVVLAVVRVRQKCREAELAQSCVVVSVPGASLVQIECSPEVAEGAVEVVINAGRGHRLSLTLDRVALEKIQEYIRVQLELQRFFQVVAAEK